MKNVLIASGIAIFAIASIAGAQSYTFNTNLTVGSTGADVVALQTWLMANGYSIPSVASGAAAKGYFGAQTQKAVKAYQTAKDIPSTGFVGPLTRGALNGAPVASASMTCQQVIHVLQLQVLLQQLLLLLSQQSAYQVHWFMQSNQLSQTLHSIRVRL